MIRSDYHVHTRFCDGTNSPEELVQAALALNMTRLGFSAHSYVCYDAGACLSPETLPRYRAEILRLRECSRGRLQILLGLELDYDSEPPEGEWDYLIGSVHCLRLGEEYINVDHKPEKLVYAAERYFGGDMLSLCEAYYEKLGAVVQKTNCSLIGHFDLITKFQERMPLFDEDHPRYRAAWQRAADRLLESGVPFEINTGAMARGYRISPYPAPEILRYLHERGASFLLSSDSHRAETLCWEFDAQEARLREMGIRLQTEL